MDKKKQKKKIPKIKTIKTSIAKEVVFKKIKHNYIFQIGFNRCATQALNNAFQILGFKTIHNNFKPSSVCPRQYLAILMYNNLIHSPKKKILQHELTDYQFFSDMEYTYQNNELLFNRFFKEIEEQNIGSSFIMNIRSCESWILSRIKLGKMEDVDIYYKDITLDKLKSWVEYYFEHSYQVREYFRVHLIKNRSKLYILALEYKSVTDLMREMGLYNGKGDIVEKVDFIKNKMLKDEEKKLPESIIELIKEKKKINGDPSTLEWWNRQ